MICLRKKFPFCNCGKWWRKPPLSDTACQPDSICIIFEDFLNRQIFFFWRLVACLTGCLLQIQFYNIWDGVNPPTASEWVKKRFRLMNLKKYVLAENWGKQYEMGNSYSLYQNKFMKITSHKKVIFEIHLYEIGNFITIIESGLNSFLFKSLRNILAVNQPV